MEQSAERFRRGGAVTIAVPESARAYVDGFRRRYDPTMAHIMPHITLMFAPDLDARDWFSEHPRIQAALARIDAFEVAVSRVAMFPEDLVLWLQPTDSHGEVFRLRQTILELLPGVAVDHVHDFVPHISIGFFSSQESLAEAQAVVQRELIPFSFHVAVVSFLQADEGNVWHCVDTVALGSDKTPDSNT